MYAPAGILGSQEAFEADPVFAAKAVEINFAGLVSASLVVAERLERQGHGALVLMSSVAGLRARKDNFVYGSTKAGLDAFAQGLGDSLVGSGVRVMVVRPGFVRTKMTDGMDAAPFSTTPEAVAELIVDGLAKGSEIVWAPAAARSTCSSCSACSRGRSGARSASEGDQDGGRDHGIDRAHRRAARDISSCRWP